jgi:hypothetical protein
MKEEMQMVLRNMRPTKSDRSARVFYVFVCGVFFPKIFIEGVCSLTLPNPILLNVARSSMRLRGGSDASSGGSIFLAPPRFGPLMIFWVFFAKFGFYGPKLP